MLRKKGTAMHPMSLSDVLLFLFIFLSLESANYCRKGRKTKIGH